MLCSEHFPDNERCHEAKTNEERDQNVCACPRVRVASGAQGDETSDRVVSMDSDKCDISMLTTELCPIWT